MSPHSTKRRSSMRVGLNLAAGGPLGAIYEIGALCALSEAFEGLSFTHLDVYVGVSAGSFISAALANQISPREMYDIFIASNGHAIKLEPSQFLKPAYREYLRGALAIPEIIADALWQFITHPYETRLSGALLQLAQALPTGLFDNQEIDRFLNEVFNQQGRTNDFRKLDSKLYLIATDLDTGRSVKFGGHGHDHVPISRAVQASAALPGLFPPVEIDGDHYVDGALQKTLHASVSLDEQADLVICVNPIVPFDTRLAPHGHPAARDHLMDGGLPAVLSQTFRSIIHSRMRVSMQNYRHMYEGADILLFEPSHGDEEMFFANVFSYADRENMCEHAYQQTRADLLRRADELTPILEKHGIKLDLSILEQERWLSKKAYDHDCQRIGKKPQPAASIGKLNDALDQLDYWLSAEHEA